MAAAAAFSVAVPLKPSSRSFLRTKPSSSPSPSSSSSCRRLRVVPNNPLASSLSPLLHSSPTRASSGPPPLGGGDVMGLLMEERVVYLANPIDDYVADAIICQLLLLDAQDPKADIRFFINSEGGSVSAAMAIFDVMQAVRADVSTIAVGFSGYTATLVLAGGARGKRRAMPNARIMIHQPLGGASGQASDVAVQAAEIMHARSNMARLVAAATGRTQAQVERDIDRERYMGPLEALEYGIIDDVIDRDAMIVIDGKDLKGDRPLTKFDYEKIGEDPAGYLAPEIPDDDVF